MRTVLKRKSHPELPGLVVDFPYLSVGQTVILEGGVIHHGDRQVQMKGKYRVERVLMIWGKDQARQEVILEATP
jgi:hypothetical protein